MPKLIYTPIMSLDGYMADAEGDFQWGAPSDELHAHYNERDRALSTHVYGRKMYEIMTYWQTIPEDDTVPDVERDYGRLWRDLDKVVFSTTLTEVSTPKTRLEPLFTPEIMRRIVDESPTDVAIAGPTLAAQALRAGLIDEIEVYVVPHLVGGGLQAFPAGFTHGLELVAHEVFAGGTAHLSYRPRT